MPSHATLLAAAAHAYLQAGLCVLPARRTEKRPAIKGRWEPFKSRRPTVAQVDAWFANEQDALCLVCGAVSGNLEIIDFDCGGALIDRWTANVEAAMPGLTAKVVIESTPSSGWHVAYRCESAVCGNLKLAQRRHVVREDAIQRDAQGRETVALYGKQHAIRTDADGDKHVILTLIETRGEGGLFLCAPTPGYELIQGDFRGLPTLTAAERDVLLQAAWELNEYLPPVVDHPSHTGTVGQRGPSSVAHSGGASNNADRPGDDFNQRGDVRAVLAQHGWVLAQSARAAGENEYWRRPGKSSGWSASLKSNVFYVFSSNAAPFEPNRAYSPFAVYALLEHGGDWAQAASSLRLLGFGGDCATDNAHGADISALVQLSAASTACGPHDGAVGQTSALCDEQSPGAAEIADPGPIPEHLFRVPGFVSLVMDFTLANAPYPSIGLAFCGAMALQSYLCGRRVCDGGDLRPNIYLLALASSGTGKDFPRKVNARVLFEIGHVAALGDKFASGEGIQDALARTSAMLFQNDEMDGVLRQINLDRENKRESIPNVLLTLYTSAADVYPMRVKAGQKEAAHIDQPHLTLFGTATPQYFYESLSQRMLTNGFFARLIIVDIGKRGQGRSPGSARHLPETIIQTARWWSEFQPGTRRANLLEVHPEPRVVPATVEAEAAITALQRQTEREYDDAHERNDEVARVAWSRTHENAKKLAMLYACSENHENPVITLPGIEWATAFAMHQTRRQLHLAGIYVASTEFEAICKKVTRFLQQCRDVDHGSDYPVADWRLRRHVAQTPTVYDSVIEALTKQEQIHFKTIPGKTKPRSGWALR